MTKLNYQKLKEIYEKTGNKKDYERLIMNYFNSTHLTTDSTDEFLSGVALSEETIANLTNQDAMVLLCNGVEPQELLIDRAIKMSLDNENAFYLYHKGFIELAKLQETVLSNPTLETVKTILCSPNDFPGFDFLALEQAFIDRSRSTQWDITHLKLALDFLAKVPYNEDHMILANSIVNESRKQRNNSRDTEESWDIITEFLKKNLAGNMPTNAVTETLFSRPDLELIFMNIPEYIQKDIFYIDENENYNTKMEELFTLICAANVNRIGHLIHTFKYLKERRLEIVNYWAEHDMALEIDIYGMYLIEFNGKDLSGHLDDRYTEAKNSKEQGKKFRIQPADTDDKKE